jgi:hypothetical protein
MVVPPPLTLVDVSGNRQRVNREVCWLEVGNKLTGVFDDARLDSEHNQAGFSHITHVHSYAC